LFSSAIPIFHTLVWTSFKRLIFIISMPFKKLLFSQEGEVTKVVSVPVEKIAGRKALPRSEQQGCTILKAQVDQQHDLVDIWSDSEIQTLAVDSASLVAQALKGDILLTELSPAQHLQGKTEALHLSTDGREMSDDTNVVQNSVLRHSLTENVGQPLPILQGSNSPNMTRNSSADELERFHEQEFGHLLYRGASSTHYRLPVPNGTFAFSSPTYDAIMEDSEQPVLQDLGWTDFSSTTSSQSDWSPFSEKSSLSTQEVESETDLLLTEKFPSFPQYSLEESKTYENKIDTVRMAGKLLSCYTKKLSTMGLTWSSSMLMHLSGIKELVCVAGLGEDFRPTGAPQVSKQRITDNTSHEIIMPTENTALLKPSASPAGKSVSQDDLVLNGATALVMLSKCKDGLVGEGVPITVSAGPTDHH
jgi:hypothetical protein